MLFTFGYASGLFRAGLLVRLAAHAFFVAWLPFLRFAFGLELVKRVHLPLYLFGVLFGQAGHEVFEKVVHVVAKFGPAEGTGRGCRSLVNIRVFFAGHVELHFFQTGGNVVDLRLERFGLFAPELFAGPTFCAVVFFLGNFVRFALVAQIGEINEKF